MVRRALTRQTRWYQNRCSTFKIKDFIVQKSFWKILEFWPLVTSILTWAKKWLKWFRNDFSRAFERRFPFCSTMRRSRDRRGGVQTPPPAGRGKSRGPAGRGLINVRTGADFESRVACSVTWISLASPDSLVGTDRPLTNCTEIAPDSITTPSLKQSSTHVRGVAYRLNHSKTICPLSIFGKGNSSGIVRFVVDHSAVR